MPELLTVDLVTIPEEIGRRGLVRKGVDELLISVISDIDGFEPDSDQIR